MGLLAVPADSGYHMLNIDKYAYTSKLKNKNPMEKLVFSLLTIGVCLWADSIPIAAAVLLLMSWITVGRGGTPFRVYIKLLLLPMAFLVTGVLTVAFGVFNSKDGLLLALPIAGFYIGATGTGIEKAARLFFKALGAVSCLYYLSLGTPMVDILSALRRLKCPKLLTELMGLIYRFIFVLLETAGTIFTAQHSRLGYSGLKTAFRSMGALVSTLFLRAYRQSEILYTALEARGYEGELNVLEEPFPKSLKGYLAAFAINLMLAAAALLLKKHTGGILQ